jgi:hypothetical protein
MDDDGLAIVLSDLKQSLGQRSGEAQTDLQVALATAAALDDLEARLAALSQYLGNSNNREPSALRSPSRAAAASSDQPALARQYTWDEIRQSAEANLASRGLDPTQISIDALLKPEDIQRIERRFQGSFRIETHLDRYDVAIMAAAGLVAGLVDFLIVRIPKGMKYLGKYEQAGTPFAELWKAFEVDDNNWLASYCKTGFDQLKGYDHRWKTLGHDPLIGLVVGTIDIMRGGLTGIGKDGHLINLSNMADPVANPFAAFVIEIMHLISDGFTKMGLPAPGWPLLQAFQLGSFGEKERTIGELARGMYFMGYDARHFLTMSASVAAAEVVLRGGIIIRRKLDSQFNEDYEHTAIIANADHIDEHPKFQAMALGAHCVAAAINVGKVACYHGNPLAINYAEWLRFFHAAFAYLNTTLRSPTDVLIGQAYANWQSLEKGWDAIDARNAAFPSLIKS